MAVPTPGRDTVVRRRATAYFYRVAASATLAMVLLGFAPSFYLKFLFHKPPALTLLMVAHGVVMTAWFALFIVQAQLVAAGRTDLHRRLGVFGAVLALAVVVLGTTVAIVGARLGHSPGPPPHVFMAVPLTDMVVFAILVGTALWLRRRSDFHKRLMLLGSVSLLTAAIARVPLPFWYHDLVACFSTTLAIALACVAWDTWRQRRLHPAFAWGFALAAVSWPFRLWLSGTAGWLAFAGWLTR
jgi:hypothetical protein